MNDDTTTRLLRLTPPRPGVSEERTARVREAVRAEWIAGPRQQRSTRRSRTVKATALLAAAAAIVLAIRFTTSHTPIPGLAALAIVERIDGRSGFLPGEAVRAGEWIETSPGTRLSLRMGDRSLRLDAGSRARLVSPAVIDLSSGALYVDTNDASPGLEVRTPRGVARDIGTQFEVRLEGAALQVRVRSGRVDVRHPGGSDTAPAGTLLTLTSEGALRKTTAVYGPGWEWTWQVAPAFSIDGQPLSAVLDHLSREQGWTVRYADAALGERASSIVLHGSIDGLSPQDALGVAIAASGLAHRLQGGTVFVSRP